MSFVRESHFDGLLLVIKNFCQSVERLTDRRFHEVKKAKKTSSNTATLVAR